MTTTTLPTSYTSSISTTIVSFTVISVLIELFKSASININMFSSTGTTYPRNFILFGDDYTNWDSNDYYLTNYISENIERIFHQ